MNLVKKSSVAEWDERARAELRWLGFHFFVQAPAATWIFRWNSYESLELGGSSSCKNNRIDPHVISMYIIECTLCSKGSLVVSKVVKKKYCFVDRDAFSLVLMYGYNSSNFGELELSMWFAWIVNGI